VQDRGRAARLRELGADTGQGWHFGRPTTLDRLS
jgi:EAL domain-containing protein (putative c-di-GMP-specific phosphodiesterase class I)